MSDERFAHLRDGEHAADLSEHARRNALRLTGEDVRRGRWLPRALGVERPRVYVPRCAWCAARIEGGSYCSEAHRGAFLAGLKRRRDEARRARICVGCFHAPALPGAVRCASCRDSQRATVKQRAARLVTQGLCCQCGVRPLAPRSKARCVECLDAQRAARKAREAAGLCTHCDRPATHGRQCDHHHALSVAAQDRYVAKKKRHKTP